VALIDQDALVMVTMEQAAGVAVLTLVDPARRNALSHAMSVALASAVDEALAGGARALVLTAEPPVFCAGGSLDDLIAQKVPLPGMYDGFLRLSNAPPSRPSTTPASMPASTCRRPAM
jgi:enoyl-CoA hydratase